MSQALEGFNVLDFSHLLQGPFATQLLGDMGANVIKIERSSGDLMRQITFLNAEIGGETPCFLAWNRNKRSLAVDLKSSGARDLILRMARKADVVVQNFRPGVMEGLGLGYEDFRAVNAQIIYCSGSGYGESGPYATRPGQDLLLQALSGLAAATGQADRPPTALGAGIADQIGAMNMVYGILCALLHRERAGEGQKVEVNLLSGLLAHQAQEFVTVLNLERDFERPSTGIGHPGAAAPFGIYRTVDGFIAIAMSPFSKLIEILGDTSLADFDNPAILYDQRDEVYRRVQAAVAVRETQELLAALLERDVWCSEVKTHREVACDPQVVHLGAVVDVPHPRAGVVRMIGPAIWMSRTPPSIERHPPMIGEHTADVLEEFGFSRNEIAALHEHGTVWSRPHAAHDGE